ncbi:hypothetical protein NN561_006466 [Cricetulus griseus]
MQPSPAGLSVQPPRCRLDLTAADPHGRGREQTRVGGAGAEAEGRAQREEAAEARSPGQPLPLSIPASGRRTGRGRRGPASGGRVLQGPGGYGRTRDPRERVPEPCWSPPHALWRSGLWGADRSRTGPGMAGRTLVLGPGEPQAGEGAAVDIGDTSFQVLLSTWGNC